MSTDNSGLNMTTGRASAAGDWRNVALTIQQTFCETLGDTDWDSYGETELEYMPRKVGYALFGPPEEVSHYGYSDIKMKVIKQICRTIVEQDDHRFCERNSEIWMAVVFVGLGIEKGGKHIEVVMEPVFRVPKYSNENRDSVVFIDRNCRIYKNWKDYLQNNALPACSYCYPKNGIYHLNIYNEVEVEFGKTPASKFTSKVCRRLDQLSPCLISCNIGISAAGMAVPVSAPIVAASLLSSGVVSLYGAGRDIQRIIDKMKHQESVALTDSESRACWISLAGNIAGVLSIGVTKMFLKAAQTGDALSKSEKVLLASFSISTSAINGANVVNEMLNVITKVKTNEVTSLDVAQLISSVIFFGHSVLNTQSAFKVIESDVTQKPSIKSNKFRKVFYDLKSKIKGTPENGKIIRYFSYVNDVSEFFLNTSIVANPTFNLAIRETVFEFKNYILEAAIKFLSFVPSYCLQRSFSSTDELLNNQTIDNKLLKKNPTLAGALSSAGMHIWKQLQELGKINIPFLLQLVEKICEDLNYKSGKSMCQIFNMIYMFIKNVANDLDKMYQEEFNKQKKLLGASFSQSSFDKKYKISGERCEYFCTVVLHAVTLVGDIYKVLKSACCQITNKAVDSHQERNKLQKGMKEEIPWSFTDSTLQDQVSKVQALHIARSLTKENLNSENSIVSYAESDIFVVIEDDSVNLNVVKLKCCVEDQIIVATVIC